MLPLDGGIFFDLVNTVLTSRSRFRGEFVEKPFVLSVVISQKDGYKRENNLFLFRHKNSHITGKKFTIRAPTFIIYLAALAGYEPQVKDKIEIMEKLNSIFCGGYHVGKK